MTLQAETACAQDGLLYRCQFVLSPRCIPELPTWKSLKIADHAYLTFHPGLNTRQIQSSGKSLTLLGYILDPLHPEFDDQTVLEELMPRLCCQGNPAELLQAVNRFGGRWI